MGACLSSHKVTGSSSNHHSQRGSRHQNQEAATGKKKHSEHPQQQKQAKDKGHLKRGPSGAVSCGKRTDFGYDKNFDLKYTIGKLLGHGQFGYTFVATDKATRERVAVKRIEKNKVIVNLPLPLILRKTVKLENG
ncbi:Calcium-dependent protein kinase 18 [Asimina triloba]